METLVLVVGLMLAAVLLVGVGDRLRLPWPALMLLLGVGVAFAPGLPDRFDLEPELILPLFLPPLLFATAQRTSWALFRARWRSIAFLAVALVVATVAAVAGTAAALVPGIGISAAIALGAMVAPPDPVAVEAVAGPVRMPRRLLSVLQSEGLFNDATALVVFQTAVLATVSGGAVSAPTLVLRFVLGVVGAVAIGVVVAFVARWITARVTDTTGRSALTLVLPFAVYVAADEVGASGVVAVVVLALQLRAASGEDEAAERLVQRSFWDVVELLVTGVAFGLIGPGPAAGRRGRGRRPAPDAAGRGGDLRGRHRGAGAVDVGGVVDGVPQRRPRAVAAHRGETVVLSWCGMRGLATLALALSLPTVTASGEPFPQRAEIVLIAVVVLVFTLVIPGFTLPFLVRRLGVATDADTEHAAEQAIVLRARGAATAVLAADDRVDRLPVGVGTSLRQRMDRLDGLLRGDPMSTEDRERAETVRRYREVMASVQAEALAAARAEVLAARREPGVDPEAADRVLRRLDLRTVLLD